MNNQIRAYESLTFQNAAFVLVDHGFMTGVRDYSMGELKWRDESKAIVQITRTTKQEN